MNYGLAEAFDQIFEAKKVCPIFEETLPESDFAEAQLICSSCDADGTWHSSFTFEDADGNFHKL